MELIIKQARRDEEDPKVYKNQYGAGNMAEAKEEKKKEEVGEKDDQDEKDGQKDVKRMAEREKATEGHGPHAGLRTRGGRPRSSSC